MSSYVRTKNKIKTSESMNGYLSSLESSGYKELGSGLYGTVLHKRGDDDVVKVFNDEGYSTYLNLVNHTKNRPSIFPQITRKPVTMLTESDDNDFNVVGLEKLVPLPGRVRGHSTHSLGWKMRQYVEGEIGLKTVATAYGLTPDEKRGLQLLRRCYRTTKHEANLDIGGTNVMYRPDKEQIVITDPFC